MENTATCAKFLILLMVAVGASSFAQFNEACNAQITCVKSLQCLNSTCQCAPTDYRVGSACEPKIEYNRQCTDPNSCVGTLRCVDYWCQCKHTEYREGNDCHLQNVAAVWAFLILGPFTMLLGSYACVYYYHRALEPRPSLEAVQVYIKPIPLRLAKGGPQEEIVLIQVVKDIVPEVVGAGVKGDAGKTTPAAGGKTTPGVGAKTSPPTGVKATTAGKTTPTTEEVQEAQEAPE